MSVSKIPQNSIPDHAPVWLVTGCSSGFGKAIAQTLFLHGIPVVATSRKVADLDFLPDDSPKVLKCALDVTDRVAADRAVADALARFGRLDVVVNNAGIGVIGPVEDVSEEQTRLQFEVNVFGVFNVVRAVTPVFRERRSGMFINFSSMAGQASFNSLGVYSASKFAVEGLSEALRSELGPYGVRVLIVEPGPFDTQWFGKNAVWAERNDARYPGVWEYVGIMHQTYSDRKVVGDPTRAAQAIINTALLPDPPFRLPLHEASTESTRRKLGEVAADLDRMEPVTRDVHYAA